MAIVACLANPVFAQSSPAAVAVAYIGAIKSGGLGAAAHYIHPDELQRFRGLLVPLPADAKSPAAQGFAQAVFGP